MERWIGHSAMNMKVNKTVLLCPWLRMRSNENYILHQGVNKSIISILD